MAILPQQKPMSTGYTAVITVVYLALAGFVAYRGYTENRHFFYVLSAVLVLASIARIMRTRNAAAARKPASTTADSKVDLFTKPKDY
jgi:hypothetical protein